MTEAEWLASTNPQAMQAFLRRKVSDRKQRLFAVACCRLVWKALEEEDQQAVVVAERYADGEATAEERAAAHARAGEGPAASFMAGDCVADFEDVLRVEGMREEHAVPGGTF